MAFYCLLFMACYFFGICNTGVFGDVNGYKGELNNPCESFKDCKDFGYVCRQGKCQCEQWYIADKEKQTCLGGVDQKCMYDEHCIDGAYCMNQSLCKCKHSSSQILDNGLMCAGTTHLKLDYILNLMSLFVIIVIALCNFC